jgi:hypothetical protein
MHPQRKSQCQGPGASGSENPITPEQRERLLASIDSDLEKMLLEVDVEQSELERLLESVDPGADPLSVAGIEEDLEATAALKAWICCKRADVAERLAEGE